jgi:putative transferase (TIGR04331 family)
MGSGLNMGRLLVMTALEETWGDDVPVLFLGEWCRLYNRKHIWSKVDALVAQPFGVEPEHADYINGLTSQILTELTEVLNKYHRVQYSERYWKILLGHWLQMYVEMAFNRYYALDQALKNYKVLGAVIIKGDNYHLATSDLMGFIHACDDALWSHFFWSRILTFRGDAELNLTFVSSEKANGFGDEKKDICGLSMQAIRLARKVLGSIKSRGVGSVIIRLLEKLIGAIGVKFGRDTDAFIITPCLVVMEEIKLQFALGQFPQIWGPPPLRQTKADPEARANLKLNCDNFESFEKYVRWQLPEVLPACHLEGYKNLIKRAEEMPWPEKPKIIFTASAFFTCEIFKAWTALKVEQGTPYIVGQHGGYYGTNALYGTRNDTERATSDKFITWGWAESEKDIPAFVFTRGGRKPRQFDVAGGLLLIECPLQSAIYHYDVYHEFEVYMEDQFRFVENLPGHIHQRLTTRFHAGYLEKLSFEDLRWKDRSPHTKIEPGIINIEDLIRENRLVVHSYDGTGILETLSLNIPTMCFLRNGLNHLLPSAKPYFELLADVGIYFYSPEAAAEFIGLHWDDISGWWESQKVQDARQAFCQQYARTVVHPARELKNILTENS